MDSTTPTPHQDAPLPPYEAWPPPKNTSLDGGKTEQQLGTAMDIDSTTERSSRAPSAFSVDDLEVARALTSLQEGSQSTPPVPAPNQRYNSQPPSESEPQPLLKLFISQHPLMASAINGSLSAYSNSKSYSPSFKVGAEFLERNLAAPMANTVNTASRISGVETGMRWWLQRNDSNSSNAAGSFSQQTQNNKRRRESEGADADSSPRTLPGLPPVHRRARGLSELSQPESLPPYDDRRSPAYEETYSPPTQAQSQSQSQSSPSQNQIQQSWSTRVAIHTSGLGVAMSDESLRSLKYCLTWLKWANSHLSTILSSLNSTLEEWERSQRQALEPQDLQDPNSMEGVTPTGEGASQRQSQPPPRDQATIAANLQALKNECVKTLKTALDVVSKYAGGALPENARWLVRCHLTSLPARFRLHQASARRSSEATGRGSTSSQRNGSVDMEGGGAGDVENQREPQPEAVTGAQRVIVLAKEGLDMMAQVSAVVDGTIVSAEDWCERLGRRRNEGEREGEAGPSEPAAAMRVQGSEKMEAGPGMQQEKLLLNVKGEEGLREVAMPVEALPPMIVPGEKREGEREENARRSLGETTALEAVESVERQ